ncbi:CBS domain-containing protein [Salisediminibacterium selenitireducens]|uniref:CBS domain containing protein n=1 Tax=Bacillus selenitireducens (strain ATCC 700615 / DSM 15326 / MLS10) TaxID=439292 RepID=D6XWS4_BACIE|nr:CBS domain-containing protein [Salisediminibacterium selenitireducens]ADH99900.1 CBS domain containing protein [[Bacillus] selenitireducens MLS10]
MRVILSHTNLDFDGFASMLAAQKLFPDAEVVLPSKLSAEVEHFFAIYKDTFPYTRSNQIPWDQITEVILVDTNSRKRTGNFHEKIPDQAQFRIFDHHPESADTEQSIESHIEQIGSTITLLYEQIKERNIPLSPFEATVFALGVYSDTGSFTYNHTTARDLAAASCFLEEGANLRVVDQFREPPLKEDQQLLFQTLLDRVVTETVDGLVICITSHSQSGYTGHLATVTSKLLQVTGADAVIAIVEMGNKTFITTRAQSERIDLLPLVKIYHGGGHHQAASANVNQTPAETVFDKIIEKLDMITLPALTAKDMMSSPVRVIAPDTSIETASKMLYRYGHTGFPVVEDDCITGIISRRDVDKALHHKLGHAPVKGYMSRNPITIQPDTTIEEIRELMIEDQIGRLPVMNGTEVAGIVSRSDVIRAMHGKQSLNFTSLTGASVPMKRQLTETMKKQLHPDLFSILSLIGKTADHLNMSAYLIGGMVRDLLLQHANEDMDIVVEGDGIVLAEELKASYGGQIRTHAEFRTATWKHPAGYKIDLTSARTEYYDFPAALPKVELSTIKEDLFRRDFTINAMGICISGKEFGDLLDYFHGFEDLNKGRIRTLYNLSFVEDPTRILRAVRFENRFGFQMDDQTEDLAIQSANNLLSVSKSRQSSELSRMFYEEDPLQSFKRLKQLTITSYILSSKVQEDQVENRIRTFHHFRSACAPEQSDFSPASWIGYIAMFYYEVEKEFHQLLGYAERKQERKLLHDIRAVIPLIHRIRSGSSLSDIHRLLVHFNDEAIAAGAAHCLTDASDLLLDYMLKRQTLTFSLSGQDLINAGYTPSPAFKEMLFEAELYQLEHPEYDREALLHYIEDKYPASTKKRRTR